MDMWKREAFVVFLSPHILNKIIEAWTKPYFRVLLTSDEVVAIVEELASLAESVSPAQGIHGVAEDDEDDLVLATAVAAQADYLVTGDKYLLRIGSFRDISIVSPRDFLDIMVEMP